MRSEIDISGAFFGTDLERLDKCIKKHFPKKSYDYRPLIEVNVEDDIFDFWFREDDTDGDESSSVMLCGTFNGPYEEAMILINKIIESLDGEKDVKYKFDIVEQDQEGNELRDMVLISNF